MRMMFPSMGNRTSTEIEELSLRTPSLVLIYLRESEAAAANVFCAKAKRQQQMFSARKRSGS
ncbi:hypothetical protein, partial [Lysinibacillus xylanilyticus]|uniref:hypothetical protein n=1 Tax=Lysinibacillus xylanilyticus TaxID=582475 RepID=UPI00381837D2